VAGGHAGAHRARAGGKAEDLRQTVREVPWLPLRPPGGLRRSARPLPSRDAQAMTAFMDTYGFLAWMSPDDAGHEPVIEWLSTYSGTFLTTEWILVELADGLSSLRNRRNVVAFIKNLRDDPLFEIVPFDVEVYDAGFDL